MISKTIKNILAVMGNSQSHVKEEDPVDYRKKGREDRDRQYDEFKRALEENRVTDWPAHVSISSSG